MKKRFRVKSNQDFQKIITKKKRVTGRNFVIYYDESKMVTNARVGVSVGKKVSGAVGRNKIKRQVRMMVDEIVDFSKPLDIIIIVKAAYLNNDFASNKKELAELYKQIIKRSGK